MTAKEYNKKLKKEISHLKLAIIKKKLKYVILKLENVYLRLLIRIKKWIRRTFYEEDL